MAGVLSVVGSSVVESTSCPFLCLDAFPFYNSLRSSGGCIKKKNPINDGRVFAVKLSSSRVYQWVDEVTREKSRILPNRRLMKQRRFVIANEVAGQYDDGFEDVKTQILNYFTYKAVRTVLHQLYELNPIQYRWFYEFVVANKPGDGKRFIRLLGKAKHELAERVMITRLHLYAKWIKKCDHAEMYQYMCDQNLELMREHLMETVLWPSDNK